MKHSFYSTSAFFNKAILIFSLMLLFQTNSFAQGPKWATLGNATSTGDFIGSTNSQPFVIKTNNITRGTFTTSGSFQLNNLIGTGSRLLQTDATGNIIPFTMGTSTQVLYGNGIWGSLPTPPVALWNSSGSNIYYNTGNVGIGTTSPLFPLDVIGDVRISNNLYVGGGIVISDKVNANAEVVTGKMRADSIVTDSTKGFYGTSKFNGDVKLSSKLNVNGTATIGGPLKLLGGLILTPVGPISVDPCISLMSIDPLTGFVTPVSATAIEAVFDATATGTEPCPTTTIPFVWGTYGNHVNNNYRWIGTIENFDFRIKTFSTLRMIVKNDGKVGIGTNTPSELFEVNGNTKVTGNSIIDGNVGIGSDLTDPTNAPYKLCVNGFVRAKKVVVETTWSDFVFDKKYKLKTLEELEQYIKTNGHLPEIPSAEEVETKGGDVGELLKLQMQKIEELTLYIIDINKKLEEQNKIITEIQKK